MEIYTWIFQVSNQDTYPVGHYYCYQRLSYLAHHFRLRLSGCSVKFIKIIVNPSIDSRYFFESSDYSVLATNVEQNSGNHRFIYRSLKSSVMVILNQVRKFFSPEILRPHGSVLPYTFPERYIVTTGMVVSTLITLISHHMKVTYELISFKCSFS